MAKKRRPKRAKPIKRTTHKNKAKPKRIDPLGIGIILFLIAGLIATVIFFSIDEEEEIERERGIVATQLASEDLPDGADLVSFFVSNNEGYDALCRAELNALGFKDIWEIGTINAGSVDYFEHKTVLPQGKYELNIRLHCEKAPEGCARFERGERVASCLDREPDMKYFCIGFITEEEEVCDCINSTLPKALCRAYSLNDPSPCLNLTIERANCLQDYAMNTGKEEVCEMIAEKQQRQSCIAATTGDLDMCRSINSSDNFVCIIHIAQLRRDKSICNLTQRSDECYEALSWIP